MFEFLGTDEVVIKDPPPKKSLRQRFVNAMIGPPDSETTATEEEIADSYETHEMRLKFLSQTPFWAKVMNINAVVVMTVCVFLYGFFY